MLRTVSKSIQRSKIQYTYVSLSPEDYLYNQRMATLVQTPQFQKLLPLQNSNHGEGTTDEIELVGVPYGKSFEKFEDYKTMQQVFERTHPDLVFLQIDPSSYIARQRFMAHKCALKEVEDYDTKGIELIDPIKPLSWEECVVNLVVLDMLRENKDHSQLDYTKGFATYSYPYLQDQGGVKALTTPFVDAIGEHIIDKNHSEYFLINQVLYSSLLGKQKVILGGMPETLLRQQVGNSISIEEMRDLFKYVITKMKDFEEPISIKTATNFLLPHVFQASKDLYMTAMLKESFQAATCITAFVGINHFNPIQKSWQPAPIGINFTEATKIPERIRGETDEQLIEKQAIMDVLLQSRTWGEKYLSNPFPYLTEDITQVLPEVNQSFFKISPHFYFKLIKNQDLDRMKKCFLQNYKKYSSFKDQNIKHIESSSKESEMKLIETFYKDQKIDPMSISIKK